MTSETPERWAVIQGSSRGIGLELVRQLVSGGWCVAATCRSPDTAAELQELAAREPRARVVLLDLESEPSMEAAAALVAAQTKRVHLLMNVAGTLHGPAWSPEKKLEQLDAAALHRVFAVNAFGPALVMKHFKRLLQHDERCVVANLSARVGSIGDNRAGGWYAYRASKAAQNMMTKCASIELGRGSRAAIVLALHPGTVRTDLSAPFSVRTPPEKLFSVERAAAQLLGLCERARPEDSGAFFAWDGTRIEW